MNREGFHMPDAAQTEQAKWDEVIARQPPVIKWKPNGRGVLIAVEVDDPHVDGGHNSTKTACKRGHEFDIFNTIITRTGRQCRTCKNLNRKAA